MHFLSRYSKTYQSAVSVNPYIRYILSFAIFAIFILAWWFGLYSWTRYKVRRIKAQMTALEKKDIDLRAARGVMHTLQDQIEGLQQNIADYRTISTAQAQQEQLFIILNAAAFSGTSLNGYTIDNQKDKGWYISQVAQVDISGSYDQIIKFFNQIKECKKMIQCDHLQCAIGKGGECVVNMQLKMTVPLRTSSQHKDS